MATKDEHIEILSRKAPEQQLSVNEFRFLSAQAIDAVANAKSEDEREVAMDAVLQLSNDNPDTAAAVMRANAKADLS